MLGGPQDVGYAVVAAGRGALRPAFLEANLTLWQSTPRRLACLMPGAAG